MMKFCWQMTQTEREMLEPLDKIKKEYAIKVRKFMELLPQKVHRLTYYQACNTSYELAVELSGVGGGEKK